MLLGWLNGSLDLVGVDDLGNVGMGQNAVLEMEVSSSLSFPGESSEVIVESLQSTLSPDAKSSDVSTWGKESDVKSINVDEINSGNVLDSSGESLRVVVSDNQRTSSVLESSVSELSLTSSQSLSVNDSLDVSSDSIFIEGGNGFLGLGDVVNGVSENQWELWNAINVVTSGLDKRGDGCGRDSSGEGVSSLSEVNLSVPLSPDSQWSEHTASSAHVTIGTLTRTASTTSSNSWNSCDGSTSSPGESSVLHTGKVIDTSGLSAVLGQIVVNERDNILSERSGENGWELNLSSNGVGGGVVEH